MRALFAALTLAALPAVAHADPAAFQIRYSAADLQSDQGLAALAAKLENAADALCDVDHNLPLVMQNRNSCKAEVMGAVLENAKLGALASYYSARNQPVAKPAVLALR